MTNKNSADFNSSEVFDQFNRLIESSVPDEYKELLKNTQEQGTFFSSFIQSINEKADLSSFWSIPEALGATDTKSKSDDWFSSFFAVKNPATNTDNPEFPSDAFNLFSSDYLAEVKNYQQALKDFTSIHQALNESALEKFETLKDSSNETTVDVLCQLWLQAGETAFKEISNKQSYIDTQKRLFESLGKLNTKHKKIAEHFSDLFGFPKQQDLDDLQQGLHDLRIELAEYREKTEEKLHKLKPPTRAK